MIYGLKAALIQMWKSLLNVV